jgi:hypothetical protein
MKRRLLLAAAFALAAMVALAAPASAQKNVSQDQLLEATALLAEYLTTCEDEAKPHVVRNANQFLEGMLTAGEYGKWLKVASRFHIERDTETEYKFCMMAQDILTKARLLEPPNFDARGSGPKKDFTPPGHLNLNIIPRRIP